MGMLMLIFIPHHRDRSNISRRRGRQPSEGATYDFTDFSKKNLHEKIFLSRRPRHLLHPPLHLRNPGSTTSQFLVVVIQIPYLQWLRSRISYMAMFATQFNNRSSGYSGGSRICQTGEVNFRQGCISLFFTVGKFLSKTEGKWEELNREGARVPGVPIGWIKGEWRTPIISWGVRAGLWIRLQSVRGGSGIPRRRGCQHMILSNFPKNRWNWENF